jgi:thioredoxin reductase (NADPH)
MTDATEPTLTVYGAPWCPHCKRVKRFLAAHRVRYENVDIDEHPEAIDRLQELHLSEFAQKVRVLARSGLSASPVLQERVRSDPQFAIHTDVDIDSLEGEGGRFAAVVTRDRATGEQHRYPAAAAFVFIGLDPNTEFLGDALDRDEGGFLVTSPTMETSMPGVFAAGDVRAGSTKQVGSAVGDGIAALLMARRHLEAHNHKAAALV